MDGRSVLDDGGQMPNALEALYIAGHSLGGASAAMLAIMLVTEPRYKPIVSKLKAEELESQETVELTDTREVELGAGWTRSTSYDEPAIEVKVPDPGDEWGQVLLASDESAQCSAPDMDPSTGPYRMG